MNMQQVIKKFLKNKDISVLKGITDDFNSVLNTLDSKYKGRLCESVFKLAAFLKVKIDGLPFDGFPTLHEDNQNCLMIRDIGFGTKASGGCDITLVGKVNNIDTIIGGTSKIRYVDSDEKMQWGKIEWQKVMHEMTRSKFLSYNQGFIALVGEKSDLDNAIPDDIKDYAIRNMLFIFDIEDCVILWKNVIRVLELYNWETEKVEESCRSRAVMNLRRHQRECVDKAMDEIIFSEKNNQPCSFLIGDKPRSGKTIEVAEILSRYYNHKKKLLVDN